VCSTPPTPLEGDGGGAALCSEDVSVAFTRRTVMLSACGVEATAAAAAAAADADADASSAAPRCRDS